MPGSQFGFRRGCSCDEILSILHSFLCSENIHDRVPGALFSDVEEAYDKVLSDVLIDKLARLKILGTIIQFVHNLVYSRTLFINFKSIDVVRQVSRGLSQGCVLSPLLYSVYVFRICL